MTDIRDNKHLQFWRRVYDPIQDLLGDMPFEQFAATPWEYIAAIADPQSTYGVFIATQSAPRPKNRSEVSIDPRDQTIDVAEMADTARLLLSNRVLSAVECPQGMQHNYVLH